MSRRFYNFLRRFARASGASASLEFVMMTPVLIYFLVSSFEATMMATRMTMLEQAVDVAVRDVRLGIGGTPTHSSMKERICSMTVGIDDCTNALQIQLAQVDSSTWNVLGDQVQCIDRSSEIEPVLEFVTGQQNDLMLVRVCAVVQPGIPTMGLGAIMNTNAAGDYALVSQAAFVIEPL